MKSCVTFGPQTTPKHWRSQRSMMDHRCIVWTVNEYLTKECSVYFFNTKDNKSTADYTSARLVVPRCETSALQAERSHLARSVQWKPRSRVATDEVRPGISTEQIVCILMSSETAAAMCYSAMWSVTFVLKYTMMVMSTEW